MGFVGVFVWFIVESLTSLGWEEQIHLLPKYFLNDSSPTKCVLTMSKNNYLSGSKFIYFQSCYEHTCMYVVNWAISRCEFNGSPQQPKRKKYKQRNKNSIMFIVLLKRNMISTKEETCLSIRKSTFSLHFLHFILF